MTDARPRIQSSFPSRDDQMFPTLTPAQIARIAAHGHMRHVEPGEVLLQAGEKITRFFVVTAGRIEIVRQSAAGEELVVVYHPGQFSGEVSMLSGRRGLLTFRAVEAGEVIEVGRE